MVVDDDIVGAAGGAAADIGEPLAGEDSSVDSLESLAVELGSIDHLGCPGYQRGCRCWLEIHKPSSNRVPHCERVQGLHVTLAWG